MDNQLLKDESDVQVMRDLLRRLELPVTVEDFEEVIQLDSTREAARLWREGEELAGFAFVDEYNNLQFEIEPEFETVRLIEEMVDWGIYLMQRRNQATGAKDTLDHCCGAEHALRIAALERLGFQRQELRTLRYERPLEQPLLVVEIPPGYRLRCVEGEHEVERLAALHRAAFGSEHMTVEGRLAIMRAPHYRRDLDLVAVAPDGELAAFVICGFEQGQNEVGYTDPIGTNPRHQRRGLGKAVVTAGLQALKSSGAKTVRLGTSSENRAMQRLAESLGFRLTAEKLWFSCQVG